MQGFNKPLVNCIAEFRRFIRMCFGSLKIIIIVIGNCQVVLRHRKIRPESRSVYWDEVPTPLDLTGVPVEEDITNHERRQEVRRALANLPEEQRSALALAFFHGYTHKEIADLLHIPLGTVKTRIRLAMQKLRPILAEKKLANEEI